MTRTAGLLIAVTLLSAGCTSHSSAGTAPTPSSSDPVAPPSGSPTTPAATAPAAAASSTGATPSAVAPTASTSPPASVGPSASAPASAAQTASSAPSTRCRNAQLAVSLAAGSPGAGQIYTSIVFTNKGTTSCTLAGHPGVSYVTGDDGRQVGRSAVRDSAPVTTVTLAPGASASSLLHEVNYQNFDAAVCRPVTVRGLRVYPPGSAAAVFLPRSGHACSATVLPDPAMTIAVVKAGPGS